MSLALASTVPALGLERLCLDKSVLGLGLDFCKSLALASKAVSSTPSLLATMSTKALGRMGPTWQIGCKRLFWFLTRCTLRRNTASLYLYFAFSGQFVEHLRDWLWNRKLKGSQFPGGWSNSTQFGYGSPPLLNLFNRNFAAQWLCLGDGHRNLVPRFDMSLLV